MLLCCLLLVCACPEQQGGAAGQNAQAQQVKGASAPRNSPVPLRLSRQLERELPLDSTYNIDSIAELDSSTTSISASSPYGALETAQNILSMLARLGYESGDNPSRILEGVEYTKQGGRIRKLFVQIKLDPDESCHVLLRCYY